MAEDDDAFAFAPSRPRPSTPAFPPPPSTSPSPSSAWAAAQRRFLSGDDAARQGRGGAAEGRTAMGGAGKRSRSRVAGAAEVPKRRRSSPSGLKVDPAQRRLVEGDRQGREGGGAEKRTGEVGEGGAGQCGDDGARVAALRRAIHRCDEDSRRLAVERSRLHRQWAAEERRGRGRRGRREAEEETEEDATEAAEGAGEPSLPSVPDPPSPPLPSQSPLPSSSLRWSRHSLRRCRSLSSHSPPHSPLCICGRSSPWQTAAAASVLPLPLVPFLRALFLHNKGGGRDEAAQGPAEQRRPATAVDPDASAASAWSPAFVPPPPTHSTGALPAPTSPSLSPPFFASPLPSPPFPPLPCSAAEEGSGGPAQAFCLPAADAAAALAAVPSPAALCSPASAVQAATRPPPAAPPPHHPPRASSLPSSAAVEATGDAGDGEEEGGEALEGGLCFWSPTSFDGPPVGRPSSPPPLREVEAGGRSSTAAPSPVTAAAAVRPQPSASPVSVAVRPSPPVATASGGGLSRGPAASAGAASAALPLSSAMAAMTFAGLCAAFTAAFPSALPLLGPAPLPLFSACSATDLHRWMKECGLKANKSHAHNAHKLGLCFQALQRGSAGQRAATTAVSAASVSAASSVAPPPSSCAALPSPPLSASVLVPASLSGRLRAALRSEASLYLQLLLLQPLDLQSLLLSLQGMGVEVSREQLTAFLDVEGVSARSSTAAASSHRAQRQRRRPAAPHVRASVG